MPTKLTFHRFAKGVRAESRADHPVQLLWNRHILTQGGIKYPPLFRRRSGELHRLAFARFQRFLQQETAREQVLGKQPE